MVQDRFLGDSQLRRHLEVSSGSFSINFNITADGAALKNSDIRSSWRFEPMSTVIPVALVVGKVDLGKNFGTTASLLALS